MKPVYQTRLGKEGNCWAACLASLFEVPLAEVDHCAGNHTSEWYRNTVAWLAARGLYFVEITVKEGEPWLFSVPPDNALVICGVQTERGLPHCIIGRISWNTRNGFGQCTSCEILVEHDPIGPDGGSHYTVDAVFLFCPLLPASVGIHTQQ